MSSEALEDLPYANDSMSASETQSCDIDHAMGHSQENGPSNIELMNMLKELKLEARNQSRALESKLRAISGDVLYMKKEIAKQHRLSNEEANHRLANITYHEFQTFSQCVIAALDVGEEFVNDVEDPDDVYLNIYFHGEHDVLSTLYPVQLSLDGKLFKTAEHLYQYKKAEAHGLGQTPLADDILQASNGRIAKAIAKRNINVSSEWDATKEDVMEDVLQVKAMQCKEFRDRLLSTGSRLLVHDLPDPFWGWGRDGSGRNTMGRALQKVRADLEERSSSVFMDDDISQIQGPHVPTPEMALDDDATGGQENVQSVEDEQEGETPRTEEESPTSAVYHKKKNRKAKYERKNDPSFGHGDINDASGRREDAVESPGRSPSKGKPKSERSVWSEGSGASLQVQIPSNGIDDNLEDSSPSHKEVAREPKKWRRNQRKYPTSKQSDFHEDDVNAREDSSEAHGKYDRERYESRGKPHYNGHDDERQVRSRENSGSYHHEGYRPDNRRQWSGQRYRTGHYENRGDYQSRRSRPNKRYKRGRGLNYYNRDRNPRRNTPESDSHMSDQNFNFEGRMYSDHPNEDSGIYSGPSGDGQNRPGSFQNNHHRGGHSWNQHSMGRGTEYNYQSPRGYYGNHQRRGGGNQRYDRQRQVELGNGGNHCQVTVENSGQDGENQPVEEANASVNLSNPQGHPEVTSHL